MNRAENFASFGDEAADTVLNALPHPILMVAPDGTSPTTSAKSCSVGEPVRNIWNAQAGRRAVSASLRAVHRNGSVKPLRTSRLRRPVTAVSTVSCSTSKPEACTRSSKALAKPRSRSM